MESEASVSALATPLDLEPLQSGFAELKRRLADIDSLIADVNSNSSAARSLNQRNRATIERIKVSRNVVHVILQSLCHVSCSKIHVIYHFAKFMSCIDLQSLCYAYFLQNLCHV